MARNFYRYLPDTLGQASAAITADAFSTGAKTLMDSTATNNLDGCDEAEIEIDVTAWTADARCEVYYEAEQMDGVGYMEPQLRGSVAVTATGKYRVRIDTLSEKGNVVLKAVTTGFTASARFRGIYPADA